MGEALATDPVNGMEIERHCLCDCAHLPHERIAKKVELPTGFPFFTHTWKSSCSQQLCNLHVAPLATAWLTGSVQLPNTKKLFLHTCNLFKSGFFLKQFNFWHSGALCGLFQFHFCQLDSNIQLVKSEIIEVSLVRHGNLIEIEIFDTKSLAYNV